MLVYFLLNSSKESIVTLEKVKAYPILSFFLSHTQRANFGSSYTMRGDVFGMQKQRELEIVLQLQMILWAGLWKESVFHGDPCRSQIWKYSPSIKPESTGYHQFILVICDFVSYNCHGMKSTMKIMRNYFWSKLQVYQHIYQQLSCIQPPH